MNRLWFLAAEGLSELLESLGSVHSTRMDIKSLADQQALLRQWVEDRYGGPVEWIFIEGQGSGELVDRKQVVVAEELVSSEQFDLVVMEDLSRHMRRMHAIIFCEMCEDEGTCLIAINDGIDAKGAAASKKAPRKAAKKGRP